VQQTLSFGQVNLLLLVAVLVDLNLPDDARAKGVLIGLATAIKLTPALFVAYLFLTGRRTPATRAMGVFAATIVVGAIVLPTSSWSYWTSQVFGTGRIGDAAYLTNQSIKGFLSRVIGDGSTTTALWLVCSLVVLVLGLRWATRLHASGAELGGALATAVTGLLVSPVSWSHHWVWVIPAVALAASRALVPAARARALVVTALLYGVFASWWFPRNNDPWLPLGVLWLAPSEHDGRHWTVLHAIVGNAYLLTVAVVVVVAVVGATRGASSNAPPVTTNPARP
jgi:alpha-1,2-mannosyltransferase